MRINLLFLAIFLLNSLPTYAERRGEIVEPGYEYQPPLPNTNQLCLDCQAICQSNFIYCCGFYRSEVVGCLGGYSCYEQRDSCNDRCELEAIPPCGPTTRLHDNTIYQRRTDD